MKHVALWIVLLQGICAQTCSDYQMYNTTSKECDCKPGLSGWDCLMCDSDAACGQVETDMSCDQGLAFFEDVELKTYKCVLDESLQSLFKDGEIAIKCNQTTTNCSLAVYKSYATVHGAHIIDCSLSGCHFKNNSANAHCDLIECQCGLGCAMITKSIVENILSGKPVNITTENDHVSIDIQGSPIPLSANCNASACSASSSSGSGSQGGGGDDPAEGIAAAIIACALMAALALMIGISCACFISNRISAARRHYRKSPASQASVKMFEFKNLSSHINVTNGNHRETLTILNNISGTVKQGQLLALLGPSGSGKTSLLNSLAGVRNGNCTLTGDILVDGRDRHAEYRKMAAYVQQDDCLFSTLTVRECIEYSAVLRLPLSLSMEEKQRLVDKVLIELHLEHIADSKIGTATARGVSGGERRRTSIGMELVTSPPILFLDEPTSGLDSFTANKIVVLGKQLASHGRIVIMSIHQPSYKAFLAMDKVLLLAKGQAVYFGSAEGAAESFSAAGFDCPRNENIADFMLDIVAESDNHDALRAQYSQKTNTTSDEDDERDLDDEEADEKTQLNHLDEYDAAQNARSIYVELDVLFQRTARNIIRHRSLLLMHVGISLLLGIGGGLIFHHVTNDLAGFQNRTGAFYFILTFFGFASFSSMELFIAERRIFIRETGANYYGAFSYFLAKMTLDALTLRVLPATLFASIFYWIMGLQPTLHHFAIFLCTLVLFNVAAGSISVCISLVSPSVGAANLLATVVFLIMLLFGGFLLNIQTMSAWIGWLRYFSIFSYAFEILLTNELKGLLIKFDAPGYPTVPIYGDEFLKTLGMDYANQKYDLLALLVITIGCNGLAYLLLALHVPPPTTTEDALVTRRELDAV